MLIAKLATGEMAYDDVWWGGKTKNPWNIAEGSSGSSAGKFALPSQIRTDGNDSLKDNEVVPDATGLEVHRQADFRSV